MPSDRQYKIIATRNGPDDYSFNLEDINGGAPNLVFNKDTDKIPRRDYYTLKFHLHNNSGCDLEFVSDRAKVLSACHEKDAVNGCAAEGSNFLPIVYVDPTKPLGKTLVHVINTDSDVEKFYFGFSFVSQDGTESAYFDPGGDNQNGGSAKFDSSFALAGAISGAVAATAVASLAANQLDPVGVLLYGVGGTGLGLIVGTVVGRF